VKKVDAAGYSGGKADAIVGAKDIIVHRLRNGDDWEALLVESFAIAKRVVTANGN
jgi:hypothetical protein